MRRLVLLLALLGCKKESAPPTEFRFSPRPNRAAEIRWRPWSKEAFADARAAGRPIFLSLSAVWCHWCHVLDETSLSDARVLARLGAFVPVRVDADQHPDVERRYILGGWPTVAVLTPDGDIVDGGTYLPPDALVTLLDDSLAAVRAGGVELERRVARYRRKFDPTAPGAIGPTVVEEVARTLGRMSDPLHGGFGIAPKFPRGDAVELLFEVEEVDLARRALDGMLALEDPVEGGFYRYATQADWTHPHYEKMLAGNAELITAYARGFARTKDPRYAAAARRAIAYVRARLTDRESGAFFASQDADERYYSLAAPARAQARAPYIDRTLLADRAARMVSALVAAARDLGEPELLVPARAAATVLLQLRDHDGRFFHARRPGGAPEVSGQLGDQAAVALALLELASAPGVPADESARARDAARAAIAATERTLAAPTGGYFDADPNPLLSRRERPLHENALFARALLAAGDRAGALRTLAAFGGSYLFEGIDAAPYARAVLLVTGK